MNKKKIIFLSVLLLIVVVGFTTSFIRAWLTDTATKEKNTFTVGKIEYNWNGDFIADTIVVPGQNLIKANEESLTELRLINQSSVKSQIRFSLTVTSTKEGDNEENLYNMVIDTNVWSYNQTEKKYYYTNSTTGDVVPDLESILVTNMLKLDGSKVGNDYKNVGFTFTFVFEAKQAEYVDWSELGSVNFSTGLGA